MKLYYGSYKYIYKYTLINNMLRLLVLSFGQFISNMIWRKSGLIGKTYYLRGITFLQDHQDDILFNIYHFIWQ